MLLAVKQEWRVSKCVLKNRGEGPAADCLLRGKEHASGIGFRKVKKETINRRDARPLSAQCSRVIGFIRYQRPLARSLTLKVSSLPRDLPLLGKEDKVRLAGKRMGGGQGALRSAS